MKKQIQTLLFLLGLITLTACYRNDTRVVTFQIEQLRSPQALQLLSEKLQSLPGLKDVQADPKNKTITITFDGKMLYLKNIEYTLVKAGFSLPHWPADPADIAKLPKELQ